MGVLVGDGRIAVVVKVKEGLCKLQVQPVTQVLQDRLGIADQVFVEELPVPAGCPIVSTKHNGIPDIVVDGETGILMEEGDTEWMGKAIASLAAATDQWITYGKAGRAHVENSFDLSKQTQTQIGIYRRFTDST